MSHADRSTDFDSIKIEDPKSIKSRRRLTAIYDARDYVRDLKDELMLMKVSEPQANRLFFEAVSGLVDELRALLKADDGNHWNESDIGVFKVQPPDPIEVAWQVELKGSDRDLSDVDTRKMPPGYEVMNEGMTRPELVNVIGLKKFSQLESAISKELEVEFWVENQGRKRETGYSDTVVPRHISNSAYYHAIDFMAEVGLDIIGDGDSEPEDLI